jgi:signal peptidase I
MSTTTMSTTTDIIESIRPVPTRRVTTGAGWSRPWSGRRVAGLMVSAVLLVVFWAGFAPKGIGGTASYAIADGVSMLPHFHKGDLVVLHAQSSYHVGEVAAYHNQQLHEVVMHRIVAVDGNHFVFKGDNNNFTDSYHPTQSQIVGSEWLHLPGVGQIFENLRVPAVAAGFLAVLWLLSFGPAPRSRRRQRRHRHAR